MTNYPKNIKEVVFKAASSHVSALTLNLSSNSKNIILCLHGWLDNAASFLPVMQHLDDACMSEYQIIAIDLPGHGASSHKSADAHYHFIDWVFDVLTLCENNGWENIHLVGHSMGGMIASGFAAAFPERVNSLTLIDSIGFIYADEKHSTVQLRKGMLSRIKQQTPSSKQTKLTVEKATKARMLISDLEEHNAKLIVSRNLQKDPEGYKWRSDRKLSTVSPYRLSLQQCKQLVGDIQTSVQVIYGSKGLDFIRSGIDVFSPLMSCENIVELEGGHHVHMEKSAETAKLISTFIYQISMKN